MYSYVNKLIAEAEFSPPTPPMTTMMKKSFSVNIDSLPTNAMATNREATQVAVAGRNVFKIFDVDCDKGFVEALNLRVGKNLNLNFSCNDVVWNPIEDHILCSAATNGAVVTWNLQKSSRSKLDMIFNDHRRTVNKVCFHPVDPTILLSGSQDGTMKIFDLRKREATFTFDSHSESVRDVQFSPGQYFNFAAVQENGNVQLWDYRNASKCEKQFTAHSGPVFACDWHPTEKKKWLATAGRDKTIKIWDTSTDKPQLLYTIHTIASVARIKWRPGMEYYIGSCSLVVDCSIYVWDIRRPFVPYAAFMDHKDVTTGFSWRNNPHTLISTSKDGTLYHHTLADAFIPSSRYNPMGLALNSVGDVTFAASEQLFPKKELVKAKSLGFASMISSTAGVMNPLGVSNIRLPFYRKPADISEQFANATSAMVEYKYNNQSVEGLLSMDWFVKTAKRYQLSGRPIIELCEHNAEVAAELNRAQVSQTWQILKQLYTTHQRVGNASGGDSVFGTGNVPINAVLPLDGDKPDEFRITPSRHTSGNKHFSGNLHATQQPTLSVGDIVPGQDDDSDSSDVANSIFNSKHPFQKSRAMLSQQGDFFFGDGESSQKLTTSVEIGQNNPDAVDTMSNNQWELPREAFFPRHPIQESSMPFDIENNDGSSLTSMDEDDYGMDSGYCNRVVFVRNGSSEAEAPSRSLLVSKAPSNPPWKFTDLVVEMLHFYSSQGDVQTCVSVLIVLGEKVKKAVDLYTQEMWYHSYIELLSRFQLWNCVNQVIKLSPLVTINHLNQTSTMVYTTCGSCRKTISPDRVGWLCDRCKTEPSTCSICHGVVSGLFVWCQGCSHGGHIKHMEEWISKNSQCPAGCGHHCEWQ